MHGLSSGTASPSLAPESHARSKRSAAEAFARAVEPVSKALARSGEVVQGVRVGPSKPAAEFLDIEGVRLRIAQDLKEAGVEPSDRLVESLVAEARDHAERRALEDAQREVVAGLGRPTYELPRLPGGVDLGGLYELAGDLKAQGLA